MPQLTQNTHRPIPILMYHSIGYAPKDTKYRDLVITPEKLKQHFMILKTLGFKALSMRDLLPYLRGEKTGRVVGLTFDDGFLDNVDYALPLLIKHQFTATCYVVADRLGQHNSWDDNKNISYKKMMSEKDVLTWHQAGLEVGGHTATHADLSQIPEGDYHNEIVNAQKKLSDIIKAPIESFAYPYGSYNQKVADYVKTAGFSNAVTTERGRVHNGSDFFTLKRVTIKGRISFGTFIIKLISAYEDKKGKKRR